MNAQEIRDEFLRLGLDKENLPPYRNADDFSHRLASRFIEKEGRSEWVNKSGVTFKDLACTANAGMCHA